MEYTVTEKFPRMHKQKEKKKPKEYCDLLTCKWADRPLWCMCYTKKQQTDMKKKKTEKKPA